MFRFIKSSFVRQFAGGFAVGAIAIVALQPAEVQAQPAPIAATAAR